MGFHLVYTLRSGLLACAGLFNVSEVGQMCFHTYLSPFSALTSENTHVTGQIGYSLAIQVSRGTMLGPDQPTILHLLDIPPASQSLDGVKMELIDAALPLVHGTPALQTVAIQGHARQHCVQAATCAWKGCGCGEKVAHLCV